MSFMSTRAFLGGFTILNEDNRVNTLLEVFWCEKYVVCVEKYSNFDSKELFQHICISY